MDPDQLNTSVEFDGPFTVDDKGAVNDTPPGIHAPSVYHVEGERCPEIDGSGWEFVDGYSNQYRYPGPVMHASEQLAGGMARDVLETPGTYVLCVVEVFPDDEDPEPEPAGWVLLRATDPNEEQDA